MSRNANRRSARRPPGEPKPSPDAADADWGFDHREPQRVIEPKLGIALVTCLMLMFGFVLYQKLQTTAPDGSQRTLVEWKPPPDVEDGERQTPDDGMDPFFQQAEEGSRTSDGVDQGTLNPFFESDDPAPKTAGAGRTTRNDVSESYDPFSSSDRFAGEADQNPQPPPQSEPSAFGESAHQHASTFGSAESLDAGAFFDDESGSSPPQPPQSGKGGGSWSESDEGFSSATPSGESGRENIRRFEVSTGGEPDPFAIPPGADEQEFAPPSPQPQAFGSEEFAVPMPPAQHEPDPFASEPSHSFAHDAEYASEQEANSFYDVNASGEPDVGQEPAASDWDVAGAGSQWTAPGRASSGNNHHLKPIEPPGRNSGVLDAPELPGLPAPSQAELSDSRSAWDLAPALQQPESFSPIEEPAFEPAPRRPQPAVRSQLGGAGVSVVGERVVSVRPKDSLWSISQEAYGTAKYVHALARYNRDQAPHPNKLRLGAKIRIPPPEVLEGRFPDLFGRTARRDTAVAPAGATASHPAAPAQVGLFVSPSGRPQYRVGKNDTLIQIARRSLGRASRWTEILDMNRDQLKSPESLKPGMVLRMPADAASVAIFEGPRSSR